MFIIIDNPFNQTNYPDLINKYCENPPAYAVVREVHPYRLFDCSNCPNQWMAEIHYHKETSNLSGETTQYCPKCNARSETASAWLNKDGSEWIHPMAIDPEELPIEKEESLKYFYVDFSSWVIAAKDDNDAFSKARNILEINAKNGEYPTISSIEQADSDVKENMIEVE